MGIARGAGYRWIIFLVCFLTLMVGYANMGLWSMVIPSVCGEFNVSTAQAQLGNSFLLAGYAIGSYVLGGFVSPRIGQKKAGSIGLLLFLAGTFGMQLAPNYETVLFLRFLQGWGIVWGINVGLTAAWFPAKNRGLASGLVGAGLTLGTGFGGFYASWLWTAFGDWRLCLVNGGWLWLAFIVAYLIFARDAPRSLYPEDAAAAAAAAPKSKVDVWKIPAAWMCTIALFCVCWMCCGFQTTLPTFMAQLGYTTDQSGMALLWNGLIGLALTPIGGMVSDRFIAGGVQPLKARAYTMAIFGFLVTAIALVMCPLIAPLGFAGVMVVSFIHGAGGPVANASIGALPLDLLKVPEFADKMFGMTCLVGLSGGIIAPIVVAAVMESAGLGAGMAVTAAGAIVGMIVGFIMPRFQLKDPNAESAPATAEIGMESVAASSESASGAAETGEKNAIATAEAGVAKSK